MARIVTAAFVLNLPEGLRPFSVGEKLEGANADHWYAKEFSEEIPEAAKAETAAEKKARIKAEEAAKAEAEAAEKSEAEAKAKADAESAAKAAEAAGQ